MTIRELIEKLEHIMEHSTINMSSKVYVPLAEYGDEVDAEYVTEREDGVMIE